jgi:iron(III) transport system permease protein
MRAVKRFALPFLALFFGAFLLYPLLGLFQGAFFLADAQGHAHFTLRFFQLLIENRLYRLSLVNSFEIAVLATIFTLLVAIPLAVFFTRYAFPGREAFRPLLLAPLILPPFVGALGIKHIFARYGMVNLLLMKLGLLSTAHPIDWLGASGFTGIVILEVLHLFPILFLSASAAIANIDPALLDAAANLGASAGRRFWTVTLPLARPGLFAGACIVFISAFTDLGTPLIFNFYATVPTQIFNASVDANSEQVGYAFVVATLALVLVFFLLVRRFGESAGAMSTRAIQATAAEKLPPVAGWCVSGLVALLLLAAVLPHLGVLLSSISERWFFTILPSKISLHYYADVFTYKLTAVSITNSLLYSGLSALLDLALGLVIAHLLAREMFPGKSLLDALAMLPLALPGLVLAFGLLMSYNVHEPWLAWMNPRNNPTFLLVVSYALRRLPYIVRAAYAGYQQTSVALEEASYNLGAGRWTTFRRVTLPLLAPSLIAGTILTFCFSMLEVSDSLILALESRFAPITRGIYEIMGRPSPEAGSLACALGVLAMALLGGGLFVGSRVMGQRLGSFFRA